MKCQNCGSEVRDDAKFCTTCGAPLAMDAQPPRTQPNPFDGSEPEMPESFGDDADSGWEPARSGDQAAADANAAAAYSATNAANPSQAQAGYADANGRTADNGYANGSAADQSYWQGQMQMPPQQPYQGGGQQNCGQTGAGCDADGAIYPMTESDRTLRLINFILCVISCVCFGWTIIPLAWMIPMTVISWGIYKGKKRNTVAFGVCTLIFVDLIGGILLLCSHKDE